MRIYVLRRSMQSVVVILGVSIVAFAMIRISGDPAALMLAQGASPESVQCLRNDLGLDLPLHVQYWTFLKRALHGDFGISLHQGQPVLGLVLSRLPATIELTLAALAWALVAGIPAGVISAVKRNSLIDAAVRLTAYVGQCIPVFWLGLMLILVFGVWLQILPIFGSGSTAHLILPAITLGTYSMATITRVCRSSLLDTLGEDYVRTARAKGLSEIQVLLRHALRCALIPTITMIGLQFGTLLAGAVVTETIFAWPGLGRLLVQAVHNRDYPLVQGALVLVAFFMVTVNLVIDILYSVADPRIRYG